ncbi:peptidoglycan DD-metalloendopeptidase family protein [Gammaproteobacteria bacterium]|nr:peptidoglycan DD-metalloendopeptidase family protein [Gammaproteobacteria bacterium]
MNQILLLIYLVLLLSLSSCITLEENYAPVTEISIIEPIPKKGIHKVLANDTLYSIAWRYGLDYSTIAKYNNISAPFGISKGQILYLKKAKPLKKLNKTKLRGQIITEKNKEPSAKINYWKWPAKGTKIENFSSQNKGINISGKSGDPIYATASGKIVYNGNGLKGYGNLIIIKHNSTYLTAYAHNKYSLVKTGQHVSSGQQIAGMGNTGVRQVMLHFEIRRNGKPVDPLKYLKRMV